MDTHQEYVRINVTVHRANLESYRRLVPKSERNVSRLVDDALAQKVEHAKRLQALRTLERLEPAFPDIADASSYIRQMREEDEP